MERRKIILELNDTENAEENTKKTTVIKKTKWKFKRPGTVIFAAVSIMLLFVCIFNNARLTELTHENTKLKNETETFTNDIAKLTYELKSITSPKNLEKTANELGMYKLDKRNVRYITVTAEDTKVVTSDEELSFIDVILKNLNVILEYLS